MFGKNILRSRNGNPFWVRQYKYLILHILDILALDVVLATRARIVETLFVSNRQREIPLLDMMSVREILHQLPRVATLYGVLEMMTEEHGVVYRMLNLTLRHPGRFRLGRRRAPLVGPSEHDDLLCK